MGQRCWTCCEAMSHNTPRHVILSAAKDLLFDRIHIGHGKQILRYAQDDSMIVNNRE